MFKNERRNCSAQNLLSLLLFSLLVSVPSYADTYEPIYSITPVEETASNTFTQYVTNEDTGILEPKYYAVNLEKTSFGEGDLVKYYEWTKYGRGYYLKEVDSPDSNKEIVRYYYGSDSDNIGVYNPKDNYYGDLSADFVGKHSLGSYSDPLEGTRINNQGHIGNMNVNIIGVNLSIGRGALLYNKGKIDGIEGNFFGNYGEIVCGILNYGTINSIKADFVENRAANYAAMNGTAINNSGTIGKISGNFIHNQSLGSAGGGFRDCVGGGAIYNVGTIGEISANFIGNMAQCSLTMLNRVIGGAILSAGNDGLILNDNIWFGSVINVLNDEDGSLFKTLYVVFDADGEVLSPDEYKTVFSENNITRFDFSDVNTTLRSDLEEALQDSETAEIFEKYYTSISPYELYNSEAVEINLLDAKTIREHKVRTTLRNSNFIANSVVLSNPDSEVLANGGAIYLDSSSLKFIADNGETSYISGNYVQRGDEISDNAIYVDNGELIFDIVNGSTVRVDDNIDGDSYSTYIIGDSSSKLLLNNNIKNSTVNLIDTNLVMTRDNLLDGNILRLHSGTLSMINNKVGVAALGNLAVVGNTDLLVDVDLKNQVMDRIIPAMCNKHTGNLTVTGMNLLSDAAGDRTEILFAEGNLKDAVVSKVGTLPDKNQTVYTPIYKYDVGYDNREEAGYFIFSRESSNSSNVSDNYNPAVLSTPVAVQAGGQSVVSETVRFAFQHADIFSQMPYAERMAFINQNKYAITEGNVKYTHDFDELNKGVWVKPFTSFEKINLHNGPNVDAITYGTLIGFDSNFNELKHGWYNVQSAYVGYNGSSLNYNHVDTTLNGGLLGLTETFYKGNFFTALTATAGASVGENHTMYGNENYTMLLGGIGSKTGYDFEFKNGKYILQPILFMNYSFVNTFDYTSASGLKMENSPFHTFQVNPSIKATANFKNGWQPYASVGFVWNVLNSGKVRANNVVLPNMSVDPYVEYGVGVQKSWKDRFTGYGQAMVRNGGRNGVALTFGFRWAIGRDAENL